MKKIKFLTLAIVFAFGFLTSCSSDDDGFTVTQEQLIKKWYYKEYVVAGITIPYDHEECGRDYSEFLADGIFKEYYIWECDPIDSETDLGTYTLSGNVVTVNISGETYNATVTGISATTLQLSTQTDFNDDGTDETVIINFTSN